MSDTPKVHDPGRDADAARAMFRAEAAANRAAAPDLRALLKCGVCGSIPFAVPPGVTAAIPSVTRWALMCEERHNGKTITIHRDRAEALESLIEFLMAGEDTTEEKWQDPPRDDLDELTAWCRARAEEQDADFLVDEVVVLL